jgi:hypothetical protein
VVNKALWISQWLLSAFTGLFAAIAAYERWQRREAVKAVASQADFRKEPRW